MVDDDPDVRDSLRRALGYAGYSVSTAANGLDALSSLSRSPANLVILDVLMPMLDGLDTCRALRDRGNAAPVLVLTARDSMDDRVPASRPAPTTTWSSRSRCGSCWPG